MGLLDRIRRSVAAQEKGPGQSASPPRQMDNVVVSSVPPLSKTDSPSEINRTDFVEEAATESKPSGSAGWSKPSLSQPSDTPMVDPDRTHLGKWLDLKLGEISQFPDAIEQIYAGSLDGISIRGVFSPDEVRDTVRRVQQLSDEFVDHGSTIMFGTALVGSANDRSDYYAGAAAINGRLSDVLGNDFVERVGAVISNFAGGRQAVVPSEEGRGSYVPLTVRFLPPDRGVMHAHTANEFCNSWGAFEHLREIAVMWNSLSYFVVGQSPSSGGDLVLYDLMWDDTPDDVLALGMSSERDELLARFPTTPIKLGPGDMILFTGGRIWHRVEPVSGDSERVTIGGFAALAKNDGDVYFWS